MFTKSARFYDAIYHFKDYETAVRRLCGFIDLYHPGARTLLDVACGTGRHLELLKDRYVVEGLELNEELLETARRRCPDVPLHAGNMVDFDLKRRFDIVTCLFSSIAYVKSVDNFFRTIATLSRHLSPGGLLVIEPYFTPEQYWVGRLTMNVVDQPELKIIWMYVSELRDCLSVLDIHYMVGTPSGVDEFRELHELGLFRHQDYLDGLARAGLSPHHDPQGLFQRGLYLGVDNRPRGVA